MASKKNLTERMSKLGMAWAGRSDKYVSPDDPMGDQVRGRKTYHVHPDASWPEVTAILRFDTLRELGEYIEAREKADALNAQGDHGGAMRTMDWYFEAASH